MIPLKDKYEGLIVGNVYHLPSVSDGRFIDILIMECGELVDLGHFIMMADFN